MLVCTINVSPVRPRVTGAEREVVEVECGAAGPERDTRVRARHTPPTPRPTTVPTPTANTNRAS
eukprot:6624372-Prymnesium_polylepis.1